MEKPIVFFDGVCSLCNGFVNFVFKWDKKRHFLVASLQGKNAKEKISAHYIEQLDTFVLLENGISYDRSTAVLMVLKALGFPWSIFAIFLIIPKSIRDFIYKIISKNRYVVFGKKEICRLPSAEERNSFLD